LKKHERLVGRDELHQVESVGFGCFEDEGLRSREVAPSEGRKRRTRERARGREERIERELKVSQRFGFLFPAPLLETIESPVKLTALAFQSPLWNNKAITNA